MSTYCAGLTAAFEVPKNMAFLPLIAEGGHHDEISTPLKSLTASGILPTNNGEGAAYAKAFVTFQTPRIRLHDKEIPAGPMQWPDTRRRA